MDEAICSEPNKESTKLSSSSTEKKEISTQTVQKVGTSVRDQATQTIKKRRRKPKVKERHSDEECTEVSPEDSNLPRKVRPVIDVSDGVSDSIPSQQISSLRLPAQLSLVFKRLMIIAIILLTTYVASSYLIMSESASSERTVPQFTDKQTSTYDLAWNRRGPERNDIQISDAAIKNYFITEESLQGCFEHKVIHTYSSWWGGCHRSSMKNSEDFQIEIQNRSIVSHQRQLSKASYCIQTMSEWWGVLRIVQEVLQHCTRDVHSDDYKIPIPINN